MRRVRRSLAMAAALFALLLPAGCGRKRARSHAAREPVASAAPTPDTTPVAALRTPAGLVLKAEQPGATPSPLATAPAAPGKSP